MKYQSDSSIDKLIANIGYEESIALLAEALPIIIARKDAILKALKQNDRAAAFRQAHKTTGSIRLYGSSHLEALLLEVMSLPAEQAIRTELCTELDSEFSATIKDINQRLNIESPESA